MHKILPTILASTIEEFNQKLSVLSSFANEIQIDIADGSFVNGKTVELIDIKELPDNIKFELHLMVTDPLEYVPVIKKLGVKKIIIHSEIDNDRGPMIEELKKDGFEVFLALNPDSDASVVKYYIGRIDGVLLMSVAPGYSGQKLISSVLEKAKNLKSQYPELVIEMDGGIKKENIAEVYDSGVDIVAVGSGILSAEDPKKEWEELQELAK